MSYRYIWYDIDGKPHNKKDMLKIFIERKGCCVGLLCRDCPLYLWCYNLNVEKLSLNDIRDIKLEECNKQLACILVDEELSE